MASVTRERDYARERRERDSFILLAHIYNLTMGDPTRHMSAEQVAVDLAFERQDAVPLIDHLVWAGFLKRHLGNLLTITDEGIEYIERRAWRRRSARLNDDSAAAGPLTFGRSQPPA